jgi:hypothetical protein
MKIPILIFLFIFFVSSLLATEIWVSTSGSDTNPGTREKPLATIFMAQRKARELRRLHAPEIKQGISIILEDGRYFLIEPLILRPEDSGSSNAITQIIAAPDAKPVISGGMPILHWKKVSGKIKGMSKEALGKVWVADAPRSGGRIVEFRQMWVNGLKAQRAGTFGEGELKRIIFVNKEKEEIWIPAPDVIFDDIINLEFVIHQWWATAILRVKSLEISGDMACVKFHQPESRIEFEHPWPAPFIDNEKKYNGNSAFYLVNAMELLNQPGEWYEDLKNGKVYYWPRNEEDMTCADVIVPFLETLVSIEGSLDLPVSFISFQGITFSHTTWLRPSQMGHVPLQAGWSIVDAYKLTQPGTSDKASLENQAWIDRQPASVEVKNAHNISFERCRFLHIAATGLDFSSGTHNNLIKGNIFRDIGGTAIQMGFFGSPYFEAHLPYNPSDYREVCRFETISNNLITDCTNEDWGCVGISIGYAHDINIEHNEISNINYSGICVGWGWTKTITCMRNNRIYANHIHHFAKNMYDVGGIYTLSAQPNTVISSNSIHHLEKAPYAHIPEHYQYIYLDEGSSYIRIENNWTENDRFFSNSPGPGNEWLNNGPHVNEDIKNKAGLEPEYIDLLIEQEKL